MKTKTRLKHLFVIGMAVAMASGCSQTSAPAPEATPKAAAVVPPASPTDNDRKASYCLGYFKAQASARRDAMQQLCHGGSAQETEACTKSFAPAAAAQDEKLQKVSAYLSAKTALSSDSAGAQGGDDFEECKAWSLSSGTGGGRDVQNSCAASSRTPDGRISPDAFTACLHDREPPVCLRAQSCESMDYLPQ